MPSNPTSVLLPANNFILVADHDAIFSHQLRDTLRDNGYSAVVASQGDEALGLLDAKPFAAVVLEWNFPECEGLDVLRRLRSSGNSVPVIVVSAVDEIGARVAAFENGADDFLVKPFESAEMVARLRARLRRPTAPGLLRKFGELELDMENRRAWRGACDLALTPREFEVLHYLLQHHGNLVTREMFVRDVWRLECRTTSTDNAIDVHVARVRRKVDLANTAKIILTLRGQGFMALLK